MASRVVAEGVRQVIVEDDYADLVLAWEQALDEQSIVRLYPIGESPITIRARAITYIEEVPRG